MCVLKYILTKYSLCKENLHAYKKKPAWKPYNCSRTVWYEYQHCSHCKFQFQLHMHCAWASSWPVERAVSLDLKDNIRCFSAAFGFATVLFMAVDVCISLLDVLYLPTRNAMHCTAEHDPAWLHTVSGTILLRPRHCIRQTCASLECVFENRIQVYMRIILTPWHHTPADTHIPIV